MIKHDFLIHLISTLELESVITKETYDYLVDALIMTYALKRPEAQKLVTRVLKHLYFGQLLEAI